MEGDERTEVSANYASTEFNPIPSESSLVQSADGVTLDQNLSSSLKDLKSSEAEPPSPVTSQLVTEENTCKTSQATSQPVTDENSCKSSKAKSPSPATSQPVTEENTCKTSEAIPPSPATSQPATDENSCKPSEAKPRSPVTGQPVTEENTCKTSQAIPPSPATSQPVTEENTCKTSEAIPPSPATIQPVTEENTCKTSQATPPSPATSQPVIDENSCKPSEAKSRSPATSQPATDENSCKSDDKRFNFDNKLKENFILISEGICDSKEEALTPSISASGQQPSENSTDKRPSNSTDISKTNFEIGSLVQLNTQKEYGSNSAATSSIGDVISEKIVENLQEPCIVLSVVERDSTQQTTSGISDDAKGELDLNPSTSMPTEELDSNNKLTTDTSIKGIKVKSFLSLLTDKEPGKGDDTAEISSTIDSEKHVTETVPSITPFQKKPFEKEGETSNADVLQNEGGHSEEVVRKEKDCNASSETSESLALDDLPQTARERASVDESSNISSEDVACMAHADLDESVEEPMDSISQTEENDPFSCSKPTEKDHDTLMEVDEDLEVKIIAVESQENSSASVDQASTIESETTRSEASTPIDAGCRNSSNDGTSMEGGVEIIGGGKLMECDTQDEGAANDKQHVTPENDSETQDDNVMMTDSPAAEETLENTDQQKNATLEQDIMEVDDKPTTNSKEFGENEQKLISEDSTKSSEKTDQLPAHSEAGEENSADQSEKDSTDQDQPPVGSKSVEELCIVPDRTPRTVSEKDKRSESAEETIPKECNSSTAKDTVESISRVKSGAYIAEKSGEKDELNKNPDSSIRKVGIHLVSTSSLVSRPETPDKKVEDSEALEVSSNQEDIQTDGGADQKCAKCGKMTQCKYKIKKQSGDIYLCDDNCYDKHRKEDDVPIGRATIRPRKLDRTFVHKCGQCSLKVDIKLEKTLTWETMDFCNAECLEKYQRTLGSHCANCKGYVQSSSLGKYCVRFGYDMKQFCSAPCLEDFKKGLKVCSYCQKDISRGSEGFLAPVGDKGQFKDFCTQECMAKYEQMSNNTVPPEVNHECAVCNEVKAVRVEVLLDSKLQKLCSDPCFAAFKFVNKLVADQCDMCKKYYDHDRSENFSVFYDEAPHTFCCKTCMNVYILAKRKIVPCSWCKVKKYNFDMIKKTSCGSAIIMLCSLHCLEMYQAGSSKQTKCEHCCSSSTTQYHLTMSDASVRSFCSSNCVVAFQAKFPKTPLAVVGGDKNPYPLGLPRKIGSKKVVVSEKEVGSSNSSSMPVISSVTSLAPTSSQISAGSPVPSATLSPAPTAPSPLPGTNKSTVTETVKTMYKQQFILRPPPRPEMSNCAVQVKPLTVTKGVSCRPHSCTVGTQTDDSMPKPVLIPVPVPIYIPTPMHMYSVPYPVPIPIALPIPVPFFIPTTRNSAKGILKEIKRIQEKIPSDPFEAELLMMAEMVAGEKKVDNSDSDSEEGGNDAADSDANDTGNAAEPDFSPEHVDTNNTFGDDVLQMALKLASDYDEPAVDFQAAAIHPPTSTTQSVSNQPPQTAEPLDESDEDDTESERSTRSRRKRTSRTSSRSSSMNSKRARKLSSSDRQNIPQVSESKGSLEEEPEKKPDANMCLKFTLGVKAWKSWVSQKNAEFESRKACDSIKKNIFLKKELLQLTSDELNYYLCLFVKEVRKPNGQEYAPDAIYYLCLGIQQYLIENGRIENIFSDPYYEKFTNCLDEIATQFSLIHSDTQCLVTRIEEEHLWQSKQLGAHSPYVLLNTLMFFNTKHFNLMTVEEHMQLSFSHIMKHWKRNPPNALNAKGLVGSRNVLLRFYPPQSALAANSKKKKVYEQQENEDNPIRCPVKLYEFYISKCPECVKTRNDAFYLLPERSCVPDSPVWYSTRALGKEQLQKMLHRIKMVKEIVVML